MQLRSLDHLVLTVRDLEASIVFYTVVLGMHHEQFGDGRHALHFGEQKINLHQPGREFAPKAGVPTPGAADLCFLTGLSAKQVLARLQQLKVAVEEGPVEQTGAQFRLHSVYVRDPDGNLIEIAARCA